MNDCCENPENREQGPGPRGFDGPEPPPGIIITHCQVCSCRHYELDADKGYIGTEGAAL